MATELFLRVSVASIGQGSDGGKGPMDPKSAARSFDTTNEQYTTEGVRTNQREHIRSGILACVHLDTRVRCTARAIEAVDSREKRETQIGGCVTVTD